MRGRDSSLPRVSLGVRPGPPLKGVYMIESYEQKSKRYKIVLIVLTAVMFAMFFALISNIHNLIKEQTPYMMEECEWNIKGEKLAFVPGYISSEQKALEEAKKLFGEGNYTVENEYDLCEGWSITKTEKGLELNKTIICKSGYVIEFEKKCRKPGIFEMILNLLKMF